MRTSGGAAMNSTMSDCTTSTISIGTPSAACIEKPPALNAPNRMPAANVPHGRRPAEQGDGDGVEPDAGVDVGREPGGDGAEHLVHAGEADQAHRR